MRVKKIFLIILNSGLLICQSMVSGEINPYAMTRTSNNSQIDLPFRLLSLKIDRSFSSFDLKTSTGLEYRYKDADPMLVLREAYISYYPSWGEIKAGKQIHSWGAADVINPTDNLNPYDYYYMFKTGTGKKIGSLSVSSTFYSDTYQIELVLMPNFSPNRIPYAEKDFPLAPDQEPIVNQRKRNEVEYGFRFQTSLFDSDISFSFFDGSDKIPSVFSTTFSSDFQESNFDFGYRNTSVYGSDIVSFIGDVTLRIEGALYHTTNELKNTEIQNLRYQLDQKVLYSQFVLQIEHTTQSDLMLSAQFIGSEVIRDKRSWNVPKSNQPFELPIPDFSPGMGTPFAMFTDRAVLLNSAGVLLDDQLDLSGSVMTNLSEAGLMISASVGYSPVLNWKIELATTQFKGNKNPANPFTLMEDFSHLRWGVLYNF